jgi:hypothetical protein
MVLPPQAREAEQARILGLVDAWEQSPECKELLGQMMRSQTLNTSGIAESHLIG